MTLWFNNSEWLQLSRPYAKGALKVYTNTVYRKVFRHSTNHLPYLPLSQLEGRHAKAQAIVVCDIDVSAILQQQLHHLLAAVMSHGMKSGRASVARRGRHPKISGNVDGAKSLTRIWSTRRDVTGCYKSSLQWIFFYFLSIRGKHTAQERSRAFKWQTKLSDFATTKVRHQYQTSFNGFAGFAIFLRTLTRWHSSSCINYIQQHSTTDSGWFGSSQHRWVTFLKFRVDRTPNSTTMQPTALIPDGKVCFTLA